MKKYALLFTLPPAMLLSGCLGTVMSIFCDVSPEADHCYQAAAVQESDPNECDKIKGEGFKVSNPPKDKCFLQIAGHTGDPTVCDNVEGGMMSYSPEECVANAFKNHTVEDCKQAKDEAACRNAWGKHNKGCGEEYVWNKEKEACDVKKEEKTEMENPFENDKVKKDLKSIGDVGKSGYLKLLEWDIAHEQDPNRLAGLQNYKEFLASSGEKSLTTGRAGSMRRAPQRG